MLTETTAANVDLEMPATDDRRPTTTIKFGTDGWRAVIADDFTFENVRRVAGAIASYVLKHEDPSRGLIVGYDTRFGSPRFARAAAEVLAGAGIPIRLLSHSCNFVCGQKHRGCRRRGHHLKSQSVELEWG